jgi:hypothetical protein
MSIKPFVLTFLLVVITAGTSAAEVKVSPSYLQGEWVLGEKQDCKSADAKYLMMRKNGTFEMGQGESAKTVGFWELNNDDLTLHMLVSPKTSTGQNPFYRGSYGYQYVTAKVVESKPDAFGVIIATNVDAGIQILSRCP